MNKERNLLLEKEDGSNEKGSPLYTAISRLNFDFVNDVLDKSNLIDIQIAQALEMKSDFSGMNSLHAAIYYKFPGVTRMIEKISMATIKAKDIREDNPLHIVMDKSWATYGPGTEQLLDTVTAQVQAASLTNGHQQSFKPNGVVDGLHPKNDTESFSAKSVLNAIKEYAKEHSSKSHRADGSNDEPDNMGLMDEVLTAINKIGLSPYQVRLQSFKKKKGGVWSEKDPKPWKQMARIEEQKFLDYMKEIIFDLSEIPLIRTALYGNEGCY